MLLVVDVESVGVGLVETTVLMVPGRKLTEGSNVELTAPRELVSIVEELLLSSELEASETELAAWVPEMESFVFVFSVSVEFAEMLLSLSFNMLYVDSSIMFCIVGTSSFPVLLSVVVASSLEAVVVSVAGSV